MANKSAFCMATLHLVALALAGCGGSVSVPPPNLSAAAAKQSTSTGVAMGVTEAGVPTQPSVEYVRIGMDKSIFVDPPDSDPVVYVRVRDTSGRDWDLQQEVTNRLEKNGFRVESSAQNAVYYLQAIVRLVQEVSAAELAQLDETSYGQDVSSIVKSGLTGAAVGGLAGGLLGDSSDALAGAVAGGLLGGIMSASDQANREKRMIAKQYTKYYSVVVDIEVGQRAKGKVQREGSAQFSSSTGGSSQSAEGAGSALDSHTLGDSTNSAFSAGETESYSEESDWKRQRARILGKAKGKLIAFGDVENEFRNKIVASISGLF